MTTPTPTPDINLGFLDGLSGPEYQAGDVRFLIDTIPAKAAAPIFREIIHELQHVDIGALQLPSSDDDDEANRQSGLLIIQQLTRIRPEYVDRLQAQMFRYVRFSSSLTTTQPLLGAEDMAFKDLSVFELHEVLLRSLVRNFIAPFSAYRSRRNGGAA